MLRGIVDNTFRDNHLPMKPVAFFDFDGTITRHDTFVAFGKYALGRGNFYRKALMASPFLLLWKVGLMSNSTAKERFFKLMFKGMAKKRFDSICDGFKVKIECDLRPYIMQKIRGHKASGHHVVIVSASIADWIKPWAQDNGIDTVIATEVRIDWEDRLTGEFSTLNCYGREKVERIKSEYGDLSEVESYGYSDSNADEPMLEFVNHPFMV